MLKLSKHNSCISIDELNRLNKERCDKLRYEYYMRSVHKICGKCGVLVNDRVKFVCQACGHFPPFWKPLDIDKLKTRITAENFMEN